MTNFVESNMFWVTYQKNLQPALALSLSVKLL